MKFHSAPPAAAVDADVDAATDGGIFSILHSQAH